MTPAAQSVDLHALANLPGFGRAAEALAAAGLRLPLDVPEDYKLFRVTVDVTVTRSGTATLIIAAEDEAAAIDHAAEIEAQDLISGWDDEDVEIGSRRAVAVTPTDALQMMRTERLPLEVDG